jgi:exonuclease VII large subunit
MERIQGIGDRLGALSPEAVLGRGYSITRRYGEKIPLRTTTGLSADDKIETRLAEGTATSRVDEIVD